MFLVAVIIVTAVTVMVFGLTIWRKLADRIVHNFLKMTNDE
jgi:hypothetical protein